MTPRGCRGPEPQSRWAALDLRGRGTCQRWVPHCPRAPAPTPWIPRRLRAPDHQWSGVCRAPRSPSPDLSSAGTQDAQLLREQRSPCCSESRCPRALLIPAAADVRRVPRVPSAALIRITERRSGARIFVRPLRLSHPLPCPLLAQSSVSAPPSRLHPRLVSPSLVLPLPLLSPSPAVCFPPFLSQVTG